MFNTTFWKAAAERAVKTAAQAALAVLTVGGVARGFDDIDWTASAWIVAVSTVASVLTSIVSAGATDGSPSLTGEKLEDQ